MAVRDRNLFAWQAYVITMAFVSVGLLLGMFFLWRGYGDLSKKNADQSQQLTDARTQFTQSEERVERLMMMLGKRPGATEAEGQAMKAKFINDPVMGEVERDFEQQMELFAPNDPASDKNLLKLPQQLLETIRIRNQQVDEAREREKDLQKQLTDTVQSETAARQKAEAAQKKAEADLEAARQAHTAALAKVNQEKQETYAKFDAYQADMDKRYNALAAAKAAVDAEKKTLEETVAAQIEIINQYRKPDFAAPQGRITRVMDGGTSLWIDIGKRDGLRVGVPFSVIDESSINISEATPKATLTVVELIQDDMARARVENYNYRNPVVPGDKVYSPAWRPGRPVGFALVGMMDLNNDRRDDIELVRELIRIAGGRIDAEIDSKGQRNDKLPGMSPNTSWLVLGTDLTSTAGSSDQSTDAATRSREYAKFISEAQRNGIQNMSLDKLLGFLKTEGSGRTVSLGNRIRGEDFQIEALKRPPVSQGSVSEIFQKRTP
ncbi:MAG: hypothetical protein R3C53_24025 [Pirellulaceae bacterium]